MSNGQCFGVAAHIANRAHAFSCHLIEDRVCCNTDPVAAVRTVPSGMAFTATLVCKKPALSMARAGESISALSTTVVTCSPDKASTAFTLSMFALSAQLAFAILRAYVSLEISRACILAGSPQISILTLALCGASDRRAFSPARACLASFVDRARYGAPRTFVAFLASAHSIAFDSCTLASSATRLVVSASARAPESTVHANESRHAFHALHADRSLLVGEELTRTVSRASCTMGTLKFYRVGR